MAVKRHNIEMLEAFRRTWEDIPEEAVPPDKRKNFSQKKKAVNMYINGSNVKDIEEITGIPHNMVPKLINRCIAYDDTGSQYGYSALIKNRNVKKYERLNGFINLLSKYPAAKDYLEKIFRNERTVTSLKNMNLRLIHEKFLEFLLKECNANENEYPFTTKSQGYESMRKYLHNYEERNMKALQIKTQDAHSEANKEEFTIIKRKISQMREELGRELTDEELIQILNWR